MLTLLYDLKIASRPQTFISNKINGPSLRVILVLQDKVVPNLAEFNGPIKNAWQKKKRKKKKKGKDQ